jgi:hypothetical protein
MGLIKWVIHGNRANFLNHQWGEWIFDYEDLREYEAKIE